MASSMRDTMLGCLTVKPPAKAQVLKAHAEVNATSQPSDCGAYVVHEFALHDSVQRHCKHMEMSQSGMHNKNSAVKTCYRNTC